ncbi:CD209 antigen-like protein C isoform X1 [Trematomus bernacchii]|uniref:CD209 antigen-like protein C isoform X1 n=1 Tax=Trematomus bernacchii TaxID=40690 RepID=UPI00146B3F9B|nr:CD209 antigen-like protein C isoform X1 [Trematomus bernacchii]XP_033986221.1 CD209 antigen-like protein C isoform X1 [Trematomus bernacchii]
MVSLEEEHELSSIYENFEDVSARNAASRRSVEDFKVPAAAPETKLMRLVLVSFGLLCVLQAALNISLRLSFYSYGRGMQEFEGEDLKRKLSTFDHYSQQGWVYFNHSFYYISAIRKSWQESRDDCQQRNADLIIINSKDEQEFARRFKQATWIGLTDRESNGTWRWVDGTALETSYWQDGEPNKHEGKDEDCVEIRFFEKENNWNDVQCELQRFWICEKVMAL